MRPGRVGAGPAWWPGRVAERAERGAEVAQLSSSIYLLQALYSTGPPTAGGTGLYRDGVDPAGCDSCACEFMHALLRQWWNGNRTYQQQRSIDSSTLPSSAPTCVFINLLKQPGFLLAKRFARTRPCLRCSAMPAARPLQMLLILRSTTMRVINAYALSVGASSWRLWKGRQVMGLGRCIAWLCICPLLPFLGT